MNKPHGLSPTTGSGPNLTWHFFVELPRFLSLTRAIHLENTIDSPSSRHDTTCED